jgi:hypothetical protein
MTTTLAAADPGLAAGYRRFVLRRLLCLAVLLLAAVLALLVDIATGPANLGLATVVQGLWDPAAVDLSTRVIVQDVRLPYASWPSWWGPAWVWPGPRCKRCSTTPWPVRLPLESERRPLWGLPW